MKRFKQFLPKDRGRVADGANVPSLQTVRPVSYLVDMRVVPPSRHSDLALQPSARDHALFETLVAAARQQSTTLAEPSYTVKMDALLGLGCGSIRAREIHVTLARLQQLRISFIGAEKGHDFPSLQAVSVEHDIIRFQLAPDLTSAVDVRAIRTGYRFLDVRTLWRFRSGFSTPLYRYIVGTYYPADAIPKTLKFEMSFDEIAGVVGLRRQSTGGWRSQVVTSVIEPFLASFNTEMHLDPIERYRPYIELDTGAARSAPVLAFALHFPLPPLKSLSV